MRLGLCVLLALSGLAGADETTDRAGVERSVAAVNDFRSGVESTSGGLSEAVKDDLRALSASDGTSPPEIWSEQSAPRIVISSIQFPENGVAIILASDMRFGSLSLGRSIPLIITAKRAGDGWVVVSVKMIARN